MKGKKVKRIALAAALAGSVFISIPDAGFTATATQVLASLSQQVGTLNFGEARAIIERLQQVGIGSVIVGTERISLNDLLAMIDAAEAGQMDPAAVAAYFEALASNAAVAVFVPVPEVEQSVYDLTNVIPTGSNGGN